MFLLNLKKNGWHERALGRGIIFVAFGVKLSEWCNDHPFFPVRANATLTTHTLEGAAVLALNKPMKL